MNNKIPSYGTEQNLNTKHIIWYIRLLNKRWKNIHENNNNRYKQKIIKMVIIHWSVWKR